MWAIRNKRTRKWVYGTDYRYSPCRQLTCEDRALIYRTEAEAQAEFAFRDCGKNYEIVPVRLEALTIWPKYKQCEAEEEE